MESTQNVPKVVIITNSERIAEYNAALKGFDAEAIVEPSPDYLKVLLAYDRQCYDAVIIDDEAVMDADKTKMESAMIIFITGERHPVSQMRIIFCGSQNREWQDSIYPRLINFGIYDLVVPQLVGEKLRPANVVRRLVEHPYRLSDVKALRRPVPFQSTDPSQAPVSRIDDESGLATNALYSGSLSGKRTIGVIGTTRHCGTSHAAQAIAQSCALAGYKTSLVISSEEDFSNLKMLYKSTISKDGAIKIGLIDVWHGSKFADTNGLQNITVYDLEVAEFSESVPSSIRNNPKYQRASTLTKEWSHQDCSVLVSSSGPQKLEYLKQAISSSTIAAINKWHIIMNLPSQRMFEIIQRDLQSNYSAYLYQMHELHDPLGSSEIDPFAAELFKNAFDFELKNQIVEIEKKDETSGKSRRFFKFGKMA